MSAASSVPSTPPASPATNSLLAPEGPSDGSTANATLRSSCNVCATSKIKCSKEKPICSRCVKRGLDCSYSRPRRSGRPALKRPQGTTKHQSVAAQERPANTSVPEPMDQRGTQDTHNLWIHNDGDAMSLTGLTSKADNGASTLRLNGQQSPFQDFDFDQFSRVDSGVDMPNLDLGGLEDIFGENYQGLELDKQLINDLDMNQYGLFGQPETGIDHSNITSLPSGAMEQDVQTSQPSFDGLLQEFEAMHSTPTQSLEPTASQSTTDIGLHNPLVAANGSCACDALALSLTSKPTVSGHGKNHSSPSSFESVMDLNLSSTDTVGQILQCSCKKDVYTLVGLVLAMFKALEWFDAAACTPKHDFIALPNAGIDGQKLKGQDPDRMAAQIVLSRLPSVQRVGQSLAEQLQTLGVSADSTRTDSREPNTSTDGHATRVVNYASFSRMLPDELAESLQKTLGTTTTKLARRLAVQVR